MPTETTLGRLLLDDALPPDLRGRVGVLDKKGIGQLAELLAAKGPDVYRDVMSRLAKIGAQAGYESGGYSFGPEDMEPGPQTQAFRTQFRDRVRTILANQKLTPKQRDDELVRAGLESMEPLMELSLGEARAAKNPLALQVDSGAKGKAENLRSLLAGDVVYTDQNFKPIPYPILSSFAEGLRPHEYAASTFGARMAIGQTKLGTAAGGYLSKRLGGLAHRLVVVAPDGPAPEPDAAPIGYPVDTTDPGNENAFLAHPAGGYGRNTHLTREVLADLKRQGVNKLLIRSPIVGGPGDGGVYGYDVGVRERGRLAPVGDHVGRAASDALAEPITQTIIGCIVRGSLVRMADWSTKPIEEIRVGEFVLGADLSARTFPVRVNRVFDNGLRDCVLTEFDGGHVLEATRDHKILTLSDGRYTQIPVGDASSAIIPTGIQIAKTGESPLGLQPTFDIEVDHSDHLFVLANGLIVSNSKHGGGVAGQSDVQEGFPTIERMFSVPSIYQGGVTHAQRDGLVTGLRKAPQGGHYVDVDSEEHYIHPDLAPTVAVGDTVEAGDSLSTGVKNPAELVRHKGLGEARRQFIDEFRRVAGKSGVKVDRRNMELIARGFMDHVHIDQEYGEYAPGEIAPYTALAAAYQPREGHRTEKPEYAVGQYLERPVLHYTIGTRVTPSVVRTLGEHNVPTVAVHKDPPPFSPVLIRSNDILAADRDWSTQMLGSSLYSSLIKSLGRGASMDPRGTSFVPALVEGSNFGAPGTKTRGWDVGNQGL